MTKIKPVPGSLGELFQKKYPKQFDEWDMWDYTLISACSLDHEPEFSVFLKWENGRKEKLTIKIGD